MNFVIEIADEKLIGSFAIFDPKQGLKYRGAKYKVENVSILTQESSKAFLGSAGGATLGGLVLGPIGLLAGALSGGNRNKTTLIFECQDQYRFIGTTPTKFVPGIFAAVEQAKNPMELKPKEPIPAYIPDARSLEQGKNFLINLLYFLLLIMLVLTGIAFFHEISRGIGILFILAVGPLLLVICDLRKRTKDFRIAIGEKNHE